MSRINDETRYPAKKKLWGKSGEKPLSALYAYHPTKSHREAIRQDPRPLGDLISVAGGWLSQGCKITLGYREENSAFYAIIREGSDNWESARAVSAWHSQLETALAVLVYYLESVNPEWPDKVNSWAQEEFDW